LKTIHLRTKFTIYSILLVLMVTSGVGVSLYVAERRNYIQRIQQSQIEGVQALAQVARDAMSTKSDLLLSSYLALIRRSRALSYAMVLDESGRIIAHSSVILVGQTPTDPATKKSLETSNLLRQTVGSPPSQLVDLSLPVYLEGRRFGTVRVGYSQKITDLLVDQSLQATRHRIGLAVVAALLVGIFGAILLARYMSRPIQHLRDGARLLGEGGLHHRLEIKTHDELGELALEFNVMAEKLQELDHLKQDFVSNVTHELRSPLTSLLGYLEFLMRGDAGPLTPEQSEQLIIIKSNAFRLARFIDNLLDVSKIEAHRVALHLESLDLHRISQEMEVLFRPQSVEKNITLVNQIPPGLVGVWADSEKVSEIFINLLSNAFKFTPQDGRITIRAAENGEHVKISVEDTGSGIPSTHLEKVFDKFEQVKPTEGLVRKTKGTGLGLTIVKGFVEAHQGKIWIESGHPRGTTVHFTLPKVKPEAGADFVLE